MKIGVNTLFLIPGEVGGSETYLRDILRYAVPRHPEIEWVLFTNAENHASFEQAFSGVNTVTLHPMSFSASRRTARILHEQFSLPRAARRAGVDVLWSPGYTAPFWAPCPQVVSVLDMQYYEFPHDLSFSALWATRFLVPLALRVARRVITLSEFSRSQIMRYVGVASEKIIPIHLAAGPEFSQMMTGDEGEKRRAALISPEPYVFCVANTYPHKNVHSLVEAFGLLADQSKFNLVLVGVARRGEALVKAALDRMPAHHRERVKRLRGLDRRDLVALYQEASVFAFPSLYEGFGLPVLEAMAAGVPVVTTVRGPMREIGGETIRYCDGTPVELARHLNELLKLDTMAREEVILRAKERASVFTWEKTADQTVETLRAVARSIG